MCSEVARIGLQEHAPRPPRHAAGFSLLEMMVVVAILGIMAAIAVPKLLPEVQKARLEGATESVAAFIARSRAEAMVSRRCVRVWIVTTQPIVLQADRLNAFDCDVSPTTAPLIDTSLPLWVPFDTLTVDGPRVAIAWSPSPADTTPGPGSGTVAAELRFRPSGRLFSDAVGSPAVSAATSLNNDDGILTVTYADLVPATLNFKSVLVEQQGLICVLPRGMTLTAGANANDFTCPAPAPPT